MNALAKDLNGLKDALKDAQGKAEAAGSVQESVQDAYDKVVAAVDALENLTAQAQIDKEKYDALVEQYNQAMETYEEALANAQVADQKLSELAESVQRVIDAAEGSFSYDAPAGDNNGMGNVPPAAMEEETADETSEIADELIPLAAGLTQNTGEEHSADGNAAAVIPDGAVPLAAGVKEQSGRNTVGVGIMGMFSALFAALLLLFKRKKDEEEQEQAVQ